MNQNSSKRKYIIIVGILCLLAAILIAVLASLSGDDTKKNTTGNVTYTEEVDPSGLVIETQDGGDVFYKDLQIIGLETLIKAGVSAKRYDEIVAYLRKNFSSEEYSRISYLKDSYGYGEKLSIYHFTIITDKKEEYLVTVENISATEISISMSPISTPIE